VRLRTLNDFHDFISTDLGWRRKEIHVYRAIVSNAEAAKKQAVLRGAIAVLYAHWEGFMRMAVQAYVEFVRERRLRLRELSIPFIALAARSRLQAAQQTQKARFHIAFLEWIFSELDNRAQLPAATSVRTQGNLSVEVFRNALDAIGLTYRSEYALAEKPVIERLLELRNTLAHGEWQRVDEAEFEQLFTQIESMMVLLYNDLENAASTGSFRRETGRPIQATIPSGIP